MVYKQDIIQFKPFISEKGYEWSTTNTWSGTEEETLHPVDDPTWNLYEDRIGDLQPFRIWSEYISLEKGHLSQQKTKIRKFANKYGFDRYVVQADKDLTEASPTTYENIFNDIQLLKKASNQYIKNGAFSNESLDILNKLMGSKVQFSKESMNIVITNTQACIWYGWYLDCLSKRVFNCEWCNNPFFGKTSAKTCSKSCKTMKSRSSK